MKTSQEKSHQKNHSVWLWLMGCFLLLFVGEIYDFSLTYSTESQLVPNGLEMVLFFGGSGNLNEAVKLAQKANVPLYISGDGREAEKALKEMPEGLTVINDPRAQTTDQNVRYSEPYILKKGFHCVLLSARWDHMPRALFLTRFYLLGSGVTVIPYINEPAPKDWWRYQVTWIQIFKFWGSLGRIVFHWVGIDNWPPPEWMP